MGRVGLGPAPGTDITIPILGGVTRPQPRAPYLYGHVSPIQPALQFPSHPSLTSLYYSSCLHAPATSFSLPAQCYIGRTDHSHPPYHTTMPYSVGQAWDMVCFGLKPDAWHSVRRPRLGNWDKVQTKFRALLPPPLFARLFERFGAFFYPHHNITWHFNLLLSTTLFSGPLLTHPFPLHAHIL